MGQGIDQQKWRRAKGEPKKKVFERRVNVGNWCVGVRGEQWLVFAVWACLGLQALQCWVYQLCESLVVEGILNWRNSQRVGRVLQVIESVARHVQPVPIQRPSWRRLSVLLQ